MTVVLEVISHVPGEKLGSTEVKLMKNMLNSGTESQFHDSNLYQPYTQAEGIANYLFYIHLKDGNALASF